MNANNEKTSWYIGGLHFQCQQCSACCCGPDEGYVWATKKEVEAMARHLDMTVGDFREKYTRKVGTRTSLLEKCVNKDCVLLTDTASGKTCSVYPVRPRQCRTWPFWPENLRTPDSWNFAALKCPGINRGRLYTAEEINKARSLKEK